MPRGPTAPPSGGNTAHPFNSVMNHCYTFHAGATVVAVKGGINGTISGAGMAQDNDLGLVSTNQTRYVTLASAIALTPPYSIMFRAKLTGNPFHSLICGRSGSWTSMLILDASDSVDTVVLRDDLSASVVIDYADAPKVNLRDYCLVVGLAETKFYSKAAADTTWTLEDTIARTGTDFTFDFFGDGIFFSTGLYGELHYFQTFTDDLTATNLLDFADPYDVSTPDETAPTVGSCSIPTSGTYIEVPFTDDSLPILPSAIVGDGGFTVTASGGSVTVANVLRTASNKFRLLLSRIILPSETVTFSYSGSTVTDSADTPNALGAFTNLAVTNGSMATSGGSGGTSVTISLNPRETRSVGDVQPLVFPWFVIGATLSATKSIGVNPPVSIPSGRLRFLYNAYGEDIWSLDYHPDDRPSTAGSVRYVISDGTRDGQLILDLIDIYGGSNGLFTKTITVQDSSAGAIAGATVAVKNVDQTRTIGWGTTDSLGQIVFHLNAGTYKVIVDALSSQYNPLAVQTLVVSANGSVTYTLTTQSIDPPLSPGLATVRFLVLNSGAPLQNAKVTVWLEDDNPTVETALLSRQKTQGTTDASGMVDLTMVHESAFTRGGVYHVEVSDSNGKRLHERRVTVPQVGTCYAEDLIDASS